MNNKRRKDLRLAKELLERASAIICEALDQENDSLDSVPENLQGGEKYQQMEENIDQLDEAINGIYEVMDIIESLF